MTIMVRRRMCQSTNRQRGEILQNILGRTRYHRARDLVRDIRQAKLNRVATLQCTSGTEIGGTLVGNVHPVVRSLYFGTTLVPAFEKYPPARLPTLDWDLLIEEAERNLFEFRRWEERNAGGDI
jgi:hypothetical protein